jgi:hypothetical protein
LVSSDKFVLTVTRQTIIQPSSAITLADDSMFFQVDVSKEDKQELTWPTIKRER